MITPEELGRRLRLAREQAGYTQEEAAAVLGVDATAIVKIERGRRGVGAIELKSLASLFGASANAFLEDSATYDEIELRVALRVGEATDRGASDLVQRLEHVIADDRWLREHVTDVAPPTVWMPVAQPHRHIQSRHERGYQAAEAFRTRSGLGESPIRDVALLADEVGVLVSRLPLGAAEAPDGCSAIDPSSGCAYVLINSDKPRTRRRFTIAHELGHLALGHLKAGDMVLDGNLGGTSSQETEANAFAAGLLMPAAGVHGAVNRLKVRLGRSAGPLERVVWLAESFGVSEESAAYRLVNLGYGEDIGNSEDTAKGQKAVQARAESRSKRSALVEEVQALKEQQQILRRVRMRLGLAPVMADTERGVTEVGPAMRSRLAKALEDGLIPVERAASMLHIPVHEAFRWIVESGIQLGRSS
jgi:Zn-dependent peptidase ImmA (M78 family)/transcriptional regulator with XRE-family HTH domain